MLGMMNNIELIKKDHCMKYAALCTGCGTILPFDIDAHTSIIIKDEDTDAINKFKCRASNMAHQVYFTCDECGKLAMKSEQGVLPQVLIIPKDLALAAKVIIDNGVTVRCIGTASVYSPTIRLSDGKPEYSTIIPVTAGLEVTGKSDADNVFNLMKSIVEERYNGIFDCSKARIMSLEEASILEDDEDERTLEDLNTPEEEQLFAIFVYSSDSSKMKGRKVESNDEIDYELIYDTNIKFIEFISYFAEALANTKAERD